MGTRYTGKNMAVEFDDGGGADPLPNVQSVDINPEGGGVDRIDSTAALDTAKDYLEGIPDTPRDIVEISALDESGLTTIYKALAGAAQTSGTLYFYPEGKEDGSPMAYASGYLLKPSFANAYAGMSTVKVRFQVDEADSFTLTWDTYTAP